MGGSGTTASLAVLASVGGTRLAVLVEEDRGIWEPGSTVCRELPALARPPGIAGVLQRSGEAALPVDLGALLSGAAEPVGPAHAQSPGVPVSDFPARFGHDEVEVQEVMLLGMRHALPKSEVRAVVPRTPCRRIPLAPPVVAGVAEYEGDLLPVLDLSAGLGGETRAPTGEHMIALQSGGFRALLLSEKILDERRVRENDQRPVPYAASHPFLYGCYVDGDAVRLIFNIAAIAMQFSRQPGLDTRIMLAQALGLPPERAPESVVPRALPEREEEALPPAGGVAPESASAPSSAAPVPPEVPPIQPAPQEPSPAGTPTASPPEEPRPVPAGRGPVESVPQSSPAADQVTAAPELSSEEPQLRIPESTGVSKESPPAEPARIPGARPADRPERRRSRPSRLRRWLAVAAIALVVAVAAVTLLVPAIRVEVFPGWMAKPGAPAVHAPAHEAPPTAPAHEPPPTPATKEAPQAAPPSGGPGAAASNTVEAVSPTEYTVAEGDTLWSIAARFTGDPHEFRRLAAENGISNPDRIYPGQKIRLAPK
jgi:nucleoid-associated protein YgaU